MTARRKRPSLLGQDTDPPRGPSPPVEPGVPLGSLGQRLLRRGLVSEADLDFILSWQRSLNRDWPVHRLGSLLVKAGLLTGRQAADVLGEQRQVVAMTDLPQHVPPWLRQQLPVALLREHEAVPLYVAGHLLVVGMADPDRPEAVAALQAHTRYTIQPVLALQIQVHRLLRSIYLSQSVPAA